MTRTSSCALEFWPVLDPSLTDGSREVRFVAYRALREDLLRRLRQRFPPRGAPVVGRVNHTGVALVKDQMPKIGALMRLVSR